MAQIPLLSQTTGGSTPATTTSESDSGLFSLSAEGMVIGIPFDQALQELLASQDGEGAIQLFAMQLPVNAENQPMPTLEICEDGKLMPLTLQMDGKVLPQVSELPLSTVTAQQPEAIRPLTVEMPQPRTPKLQTDVIAPKLANMINLVSAEKPAEILPLITGETSEKGLLEISRGSDSQTPYSLNALSQSATSAVANRPGIVLPLNIPVGQAGWGQAVGERVQWMVNQNVQQAEIKLTPPNLGPMEIKISIHNDQTNVTFIAAQAPTREAIESSIPRLREMFGEINLNLANVDVGHRQAGEPGGEGAGPSQGGGGVADNEQLLQGWSADLGSVVIQSGNGLLDIYA